MMRMTGGEPVGEVTRAGALPLPLFRAGVTGLAGGLRVDVVGARGALGLRGA